MSDISAEKHLRLVKAVIRTSDYSHPIVLSTCRELNIDPEDLRPRKLKDFADKRTCLEIHELRFNHFEAKRRVKMEKVASAILKSGVNIINVINQDLKPVHFQRYSLSPERSEAYVKPKTVDTTTAPLTGRDSSQRKLKFQKRKLERFLRVMGNIKEIKQQEEIRKMKLNSEQEKRVRKIEEEKIMNEEKRIEKIMKLNARREEKLKRKIEVLKS